MKKFEIIADVVEKIEDIFVGFLTIVMYILSVGVLSAAMYFFARWLIGG